MNLPAAAPAISALSKQASQEALQTLLTSLGPGLSQDSRLLTLSTAQSGKLPDSLVVERYWGVEGINTLYRFDIDAVSVNTALDLTALIGEEITLRVLLPQGGHQQWHGYCTQAYWLGADGGLARYHLVLQPYLSALGERTDAWIFQDKDTIGIIQELLADYAGAQRPSAVRFDITQHLPVRAICTQYGETDLAFLQRILASEGLSWRFEHNQESQQDKSPATNTSTDTPHSQHTLVIFDAASSLQDWSELTPSTIRYHRADATEESDTITSFAAQRRISANAVALSSWDPTQLHAPAAQTSSSLDSGALPHAEIYDGSGQHRYTPASSTASGTGNSTGTNTATPDYAQQIAQLRLHAIELPRKTYQGTSSVRHMVSGQCFTLAQHEHHPEGANRFKLLHIEHGGANNLNAQVSQLLDALDAKLNTQQSAREKAQQATSARAEPHQDTHPDADLQRVPRGSYRNRFSAVRDTVPVVPEASANPAAYAPPVAPRAQSATVVGVEGQITTTDRDHRIKVQFAWQREQDSGNNAPGNETSGTWVRVSEALAGPNWGSQFTPRIGAEVLVDFHDADMDQPVVVAQLYNGQDTPPFAAGVEASANHGGVISGWHSHNHHSTSHYNQWVLDDTRGQLRMRLASSTAASQLNLGYLIAQPIQSAQRGSYRGAGFELRTDAWGSLRAPQGLLLTTTERPTQGESVASTQLDTQEARGQLQAASELTHNLHQAAQSQQALGSQSAQDSAAAQKRLKEELDPADKGSYAAQGKKDLNGQALHKPQAGSRTLHTAKPHAVEQFAAPWLITDTPSSLSITSPASSAYFAGEQLLWSTQADSHYSAGHTVSAVTGKGHSLFTHAGGLEAVSANAALTLQAHTAPLEVLADQDIKVISAQGSIEIKAKSQITLKAGQTQLMLDGGNITFTSPGNWVAKGSGHSLQGGGSNAASLNQLPSGLVSPVKEDIHLSYQYHDEEGIRGAQYTAKLSNGEVRTGTLDAAGKATITGVPAGTTAEVTYSPAAFPYKAKSATPNPTYDPKLDKQKLVALVDKYAAEMQSGTKK